MDFSMFEKLQHTSEMANMQNHPEMHMQKRYDKSDMSRFPEKTPLAMAYVPVQQWGETYSIENGFARGTVFPELDLPFAPGEGCL